jgi:NADH dehydrogenase FAD-containing subunit
VKDWWLSPDTPVSSINKTDHHDITEILLKVALNTITLKKIAVPYAHD